jgi:hypothetical protein
MVKEIIIPQENLAQVEEIREIEEKRLTEKDFFIGCPDEDDARKGAKKVVQGELGVFTVINPVAGVATGAAMEGVGKAVEGIGEATGSKEAKAVGKGTQDATEEPLKKVGDKVEETGKDLKEGVKDLGNKIGSLFE